MGESLQQYSKRLRLEAARHLLRETDLAVGEVAAELGYSDPLYFSRLFRKLWGGAPVDDAIGRDLLRSTRGSSDHYDF